MVNYVKLATDKRLQFLSYCFHFRFYFNFYIIIIYFCESFLHRYLAEHPLSLNIKTHSKLTSA